MRRVLVVVTLLLATVGAFLWWEAGRLEHFALTDSVHVYTGVGGNVGALVTPEGVVVVDTMTFVRQGDAIRRAIAELTAQPVVAVMNTHYHLDHTHGNPAFPVGTRVVSTTKTLVHLHERDAGFWKDRPAADLLPNDTFEGSTKEIRLGGKTIRAYQLGRGHTDGDMVVLFVEDRVLHVGDLCFNGHYPDIDLEAGGSVQQWAGTLDKALALPFDQVIPGHGAPTTRAGLERCRDLMSSLWSQTTTIRKRGGTLEQAIKLVQIDEFGLWPLWFAPTLNRGSVIRRAWEEAAHKGGA